MTDHSVQSCVRLLQGTRSISCPVSGLHSIQITKICLFQGLRLGRWNAMNKPCGERAGRTDQKKAPLNPACGRNQRLHLVR